MITPYERLANAIVLQAVEDFRTKNTSFGGRKAQERFFKSEWFMVLTDLDGVELLKRLQEEEEQRARDSEKRWRKYRLMYVASPKGSKSHV